MSSRAIQRLRQEREAKLPQEESSDEEDEIGSDTAGGAKGFASMMFDDSDSDSDEDDKSSESDEETEEDKNTAEENPKISGAKSERKEANNTTSVAGVSSETKQSEDLDALLAEFKFQDEEVDDIPQEQSSWYDIVTSRIDAKDLDIDYVMRTSLLGSNEDSATRASNRRGRQANVFGPPRDGWPRPPHYVGGGVGMVSYDNESFALPWPYSNMKEGDERCPGLDRWFKFIFSDSYERDGEDYERIKASGDPNALALFIAHHPYVIEGLLQLSSVLYQTNQNQEGLSLLKRTLFVFECACLNSFLKVEGRIGFMDYDQADNKQFFSTLFRLVRVSHVAGLPRASLAISKFLLSLDPLRDPMGILLALDNFSLLTNSEKNNIWLIEFVESDKVRICYQDKTNSKEYECGLQDLPNWSYAYALTLFRINENQSSADSQKKADHAIQMALSRFPTVLQHLLTKNEVDVTGRSVQTDWPSVLEYLNDLSNKTLNTLSDAAASDPIVRACTSQAYEVIVRIFVLQSFKLWSSDKVLRWIYKNLTALKDSQATKATPPLSPAMMRYARSDPSNYEDKFQTMPADANPLDPALVAHALNVDPNRRRLMQRMPRDGPAEVFDLPGNQQGANLLGPPTEMIDPDWPLLEVYWRSLAPWAHVEGVPPPRR